jgi:hypothetical protein
MDLRCTLNHNYGQSISDIEDPKQAFEMGIAQGLKTYELTPCPVTGDHHEPEILISVDNWVDVTCKACKWRAMGTLNLTLDEIIEKDENDPGWDEDIPISDLESLVPDSAFQENWDDPTIDLTTLMLWKETIYGIGGTSIFSQLGLDPVDEIYHTHSKMPFPDPQHPKWVIWPI